METRPHAPHRRLRAWASAHDLVVLVYKASATWPAAERYGLISQVRRAAVSVELSLAEGASRKGPVEFARYVSIALGSLAEVECATGIACELGYLTPAEHASIEGRRREAGGQLWKLLASLRRARPT